MKMQAIYLVKNGSPETAFELRTVPVPEPGAGQVRIEVTCFGLNFADVMARLGLYRATAPLPCVIGYEVVGTIHAVGEGVTDFKVGQRVVAFTRFSGYAQFAVSDHRAVALLPDNIEAGEATALATQYGTAYYAGRELVNLHPGDKVLVQAAAGGVGTALVQLCKAKGCEVFGTAGSEEKLNYLREQGVDHPINYRTQDFEAIVKEKTGPDGLDAAFDSVGGKTFRKGFNCLGPGGRLVAYGAAERSSMKGMFSTLRLVWNFGLIIPVKLIMFSRSVIGLNMLEIADRRPEVLKRIMKNIVALAETGEVKPHVGARFTAENIAQAHRLLESRKSIGKVAVYWKDLPTD